MNWLVKSLHLFHSQSKIPPLRIKEIFKFTTNSEEQKKDEKSKERLKEVILIPLFLLFSGLGIYQYTKYHFLKYVVPEDNGLEPEIYDEVKVPSRIIRLVKYVHRFVGLLLIFIPSILTLPFALFNSTLDLWLSVFVWSIENAGVVWIKAFQYLSHRRDVIGPKMAEKFAHLRDNSPIHSEQETKNIFRRVYGVKIDQMFDEFDYKPIASGSISQVYKAKFKGKNVALKVRHPNVEKNIERDIDLLFFFSRLFSKVSKNFEIPVNNESLKKILIDQVYFTRESKNLNKYNSIFKNPDVKFPFPFPQTNDEVLVESFAEGFPITYYVDHPHKLNQAIAFLGVSTFFEMLMTHNFVHADCHGGNILVRIEKNIKWNRKFIDMFKNLQNWMIAYAIETSFDLPHLKKLAKENYQYEKSIHELIIKERSTVELTILDVGMVINLNEGKKKAFGDFLKEIVSGNAKECARMIYNISSVGNRSLKEFKHIETKYLEELEDMFSIINKTELADLQGIDVLSGMLRVVRKHNMKIDGEISILFTNMLVLEAMAKDLDPKINILRCVIPFLVPQIIEEKELQLKTVTPNHLTGENYYWEEFNNDYNIF